MRVTKLNRTTAMGDMLARMTPFRSCMDIGCGIRPMSDYGTASLHHVLVDPHGPYLERATRDLTARGIPCTSVEADWATAVKMYWPKCVDTVFLLDVIEHLPKEEGVRLLPGTMTLAVQQVLIFTPYGFMPQEILEGADQWGMDTGGNQLQAHLSGWTEEDFDERWQIFVCDDFHQVDYKGDPLPRHCAAMWALYNVG